ncbi:hypothetical protein REIS_1481 [Rickettsia endosymbiont of Ixodes scapularis]|nr:hypothetical protein REIS_1481 [Rickettsia endosymbiont of Ixodes scapularis]
MLQKAIEILMIFLTWTCSLILVSYLLSLICSKPVFAVDSSSSIVLETLYSMIIAFSALPACGSKIISALPSPVSLLFYYLRINYLLKGIIA